MSPPLGLEAIRERAYAARLNSRQEPHCPHNVWLHHYAEDVPALLAEIDRLREQLTRQEVSRG